VRHSHYTGRKCADVEIDIIITQQLAAITFTLYH